jgi:hypothetical protein
LRLPLIHKRIDKPRPARTLRNLTLRHQLDFELQHDVRAQAIAHAVGERRTVDDRIAADADCGVIVAGTARVRDDDLKPAELGKR